MTSNLPITTAQSVRFFLPGNLESWRVRESAECVRKLGSLDYRCHVNANAKRSRRTKQCLEHFKSTSVDELVEQFGMKYV